MVIIETKMLNVSEEKLKEMREWVQEQTQQEVIMLPCGCKLVKVKEEAAAGNEELKTIELLGRGDLCPLQFGIQKSCNEKGCKECWEEELEDKEELKKFTAKDVKRILKNLEREWNGW